MNENPSEADFPEHIDHAVRSVTQLHADHHRRATTPQRAINRISALMGRPWFIAVVAIGAALWVLANLIAGRLGVEPIDPAPFPWLGFVATLFSLLVVMLVLVAQRHEDELNAHRDTLTLELAILSERKIAKIIQLLEELRRDSPHVHDRDDPQAQQMAAPADAGSVLAATRAKAEG